VSANLDKTTEIVSAISTTSGFSLQLMPSVITQDIKELPQQPIPEPPMQQHPGMSQTPSSQADDTEPFPAFNLDKLQEVGKQMEERRKERMKTLTRNLEVCDLLDIRNPQSVAEYAPQIYRYLHQEEKRHMYP